MDLQTRQQIVLYSIIGFLLVSILLVSSFFGLNIQSNTNKLEIFTTVYPWTFILSEVGGKRVDVTNLTPYSSDPFAYEPTLFQRDLALKSDLLVTNGDMEPWLITFRTGNTSLNLNNLQVNRLLPTKLLPNPLTVNEVISLNETLTSEQKPVEEIPNLIKNKYLTSPQTVSPYFWLSPKNTLEIARIFKERLQSLDPQFSKTYEENFQNLAGKLKSLETKIEEGIVNQCNLSAGITDSPSINFLTYDLSLRLDVIVFNFQKNENGNQTNQLEQNTLDTLKKAKDLYKNEFLLIERPLLTSTKDQILEQTGFQVLEFDSLIREPVNFATYLEVMDDNIRNLRIALDCLPAIEDQQEDRQNFPQEDFIFER